MPQLPKPLPRKKNLPFLECKVYHKKTGELPHQWEDITVLSRRPEKNGGMVFLLSSVTFGSIETSTYGTPEYEALLKSFGIETPGMDVPVADVTYDDDAHV